MLVQEPKKNGIRFRIPKIGNEENFELQVTYSKSDKKNSKEFFSEHSELYELEIFPTLN